MARLSYLVGVYGSWPILFSACAAESATPTQPASAPSFAEAGAGAIKGASAGMLAAGVAHVATAAMAGNTASEAGTIPRSGASAIGTGGPLTGSSGSGAGGTTRVDAGGAGAGGVVASAGVTAGAASERRLPNSDPKYMNLAPPLGEPLDGKGQALTPTAPTGWIWYEIAGAVCRDGSPTGFFVHTGSVDKLLIYLEGGGACSNGNYCNFNPASASSSLAGDGQTVIGSALGAIDGRQQPGVYTSLAHDGAPAGIFDFANAANPFKDWSEIYIPYCTGDVFFGTKQPGSVPGLSNQQFVGYLNMKLFVARIVPTFKDKVSRVIVTGASAGGFGAVLNYSMIQDSFGSVPVDLLNDSGPTFTDKFTATCMQKRWRDSWGFDSAFPADCSECRQPDGGGLLGFTDFILKKHPNLHFGLISGMEDQVIRLFYSVGIDNCSQYDTLDPAQVTLDQSLLYPADQYIAGLEELRARYVPSGRYSTFFIAGADPSLHQHLFRPEFFQTVGATSLAAFVDKFLAGEVMQVGP